MNIYLYGIPPLQQRESLYSWLQRLAQSQGMSYTQITQLLELSRIKDMDAPKLPIHKNTFSKISNFNEVWFQGLFAINKSIRQFKSVKKQLRINHDKKPITSVCCECLKTDVLPYFRIEWRFNFWKVCPLHAIELNTTCPHCNSEIILSNSLLTGLNSVPDLRYCQSCLLEFSNTKSKEEIFPALQDQIQTQNNMMASIVTGYCQIVPLNKRFNLNIMFRIYELGILHSAATADFEAPVSSDQREALINFIASMNKKILAQERLHNRARNWRSRNRKICIPEYERVNFYTKPRLMYNVKQEF
ncbi:TniQ family protein [Undibacterium sp. FT79W]|uniref:TniQ family protein n=1 Tax=Undibacterium sp. FT79W TaxID=2762296 RepID=UPI00164AFC7D|nr:TniQ family protein [Undibacterium sp. FT79W]MBC3878412.1 TniQ family protein [Undibacterium sp. FT79W]